MSSVTHVSKLLTRRFSRTKMARWKLFVRITAGLALVATFIRLLHLLRLPVVFLLLPVSLCALPWILKYVPGLQDDNSKATITGVLTGVTTGFLAAVERTWTSQMRMMGYIDPNENPMSFALQLIQGLEILHLPLMAFMIVHSFDRIFYRWPSTPSLLMAAVTAFFADFLVIFCLVVFHEVDRPLNDLVSIFILIYGILLLLCLLPLFRETQQCWILHIIMFSVIMYWELMGLGVATWDLSQNSYPVPGYIASLIYIFHSPALDEDEDLPKQFDVMYSLNAKDSKKEQERVETSIIWHVGAQVTERIALLKMFGKSSENNDCVIACVTQLLLTFVFSPFYKGSRLQIVMCGMAVVLLYFCISMSYHSLHNSHHIDGLLGLLTMYLSVPTMADMVHRRIPYPQKNAMD